MYLVVLLILTLLTNCSPFFERVGIPQIHKEAESALMSPANMLSRGDETTLQPNSTMVAGTSRHPVVIHCRPFPLGLEADCDPE